MSDEEIVESVDKAGFLGGMTVNERLFVCGLMDEFDKARTLDNGKARKILRLIGVDESSIEKIISR